MVAASFAFVRRACVHRASFIFSGRVKCIKNIIIIKYTIALIDATANGRSAVPSLPLCRVPNERLCRRRHLFLNSQQKERRGEWVAANKTIFGRGVARIERDYFVKSPIIKEIYLMTSMACDLRFYARKTFTTNSVLKYGRESSASSFKQTVQCRLTFVQQLKKFESIF